ncbi:putative ATP-dependent RNA helicase DDX10 [Lamellibrachia satsuma]|nr:putative ATP-dependent RNA helicase DDX10 [Lamellibrachia satsuma]
MGGIYASTVAPRGGSGTLSVSAPFGVTRTKVATVKHVQDPSSEEKVNMDRKRQRSSHNSKDVDKKTAWKKKDSKIVAVDHEIEQLKAKYNEIDVASVEKFLSFPLSQKTQQGLKAANYEKPTDIQRQSIGLALKGKDILGAAKTGSGKTLAFLIPTLECLYNLKWSHLDGLGALIISPTRELAYQIFEMLKTVGKFHDFSAGLIIGGKPLREEAERINRTNIVICTPGRLLQHMDETAYFNADNLQVLVLDEADRILDMGFAQTMNAIVENLPTERQTLLFSATQTKSVKDLARLSLKQPVYVSVHENAAQSTPTQLEQSYIVSELGDKMDLLWSFIKNHLKKKILIFISSCKQVRFYYECMRQLRPGLTVLALHGAMTQLKRTACYQQFCRKQNAVLFATDLAARGLDFPAVDWVVQLDCPEDANTYIHRVGRTARYEKNGEALLVLLASEEQAMTDQLKTKKIPIEKIRVNPKKKWSIQPKLQSMCAADVQLKEFAQRVRIISQVSMRLSPYVKSVFLMSNKKVFDVTKLDVDKYANSMGLAVTPRLRFLQKYQKQQSLKDDMPHDVSHRVTNPRRSPQSQTPSLLLAGSDGSGSEETGNEDDAEIPQPPHREQEAFGFDVDDDLDDILKVKVKTGNIDDNDDAEKEHNIVEVKESARSKKAQTKFALAKKLAKKNIQVNTKVVFDDEGKEVMDVHKKMQTMSSDGDDYEAGINIEQAKKSMAEEDKFDKQLYRDKIKQKHKEKKLKEKEKRRAAKKEAAEDEDSEGEPLAVLDTDDVDRCNIDDLPDPDKYYGPAASDEEEEDGESSEEEDGSDSELTEESDSEGDVEESDEESDEDDRPSEKRRKWARDDNLGLDTVLGDDEDLALKLLQQT